MIPWLRVDIEINPVHIVRDPGEDSREGFWSCLAGEAGYTNLYPFSNIVLTHQWTTRVTLDKSDT